VTWNGEKCSRKGLLVNQWNFSMFIFRLNVLSTLQIAMGYHFDKY
jgi:hypothetical protein